LGVTKAYSRPYTSTDNPYSEAQFKTLKYRPGFPARFTSILEARAVLPPVLPWYNQQHRHSGIWLMTPSTVHHGLAEQTHTARTAVLNNAYAATPERLVRRAPRPPALPTGAWINQPADTEEVAHQIRASSVSPSLTGSEARRIAAGHKGSFQSWSLGSFWVSLPPVMLVRAPECRTRSCRVAVSAPATPSRL
jgi:hypothetical protein